MIKLTAENSSVLNGDKAKTLYHTCPVNILKTTEGTEDAENTSEN